MKLTFFLHWAEKCIILTEDQGNNTNNKLKVEITDTKL